MLAGAVRIALTSVIFSGGRDFGGAGLAGWLAGTSAATGRGVADSQLKPARPLPSPALCIHVLRFMRFSRCLSVGLTSFVLTPSQARLPAPFASTPGTRASCSLPPNGTSNGRIRSSPALAGRSCRNGNTALVTVSSLYILLTGFLPTAAALLSTQTLCASQLPLRRRSNCRPNGPCGTGIALQRNHHATQY